MIILFVSALFFGSLLPHTFLLCWFFSRISSVTLLLIWNYLRNVIIWKSNYLILLRGILKIGRLLLFWFFSIWRLIDLVFFLIVWSILKLLKAGQAWITSNVNVNLLLINSVHDDIILFVYLFSHYSPIILLLQSILRARTPIHFTLIPRHFILASKWFNKFTVLPVSLANALLINKILSSTCNRSILKLSDEFVAILEEQVPFAMLLEVFHLSIVNITSGVFYLYFSDNFVFYPIS